MPEAEGWEARARELSDAMRASLYDEDEQVYSMQESDRLPLQASGLVATGPTAWLVWPMTLYAYSDPQVEKQLELESAGGLYYVKNTISLAVAGRGTFDETIDALAAVLSDQATPQTHHFGEVMVVDDSEEPKRADQRVSNPHLWEGALYYLTVLAVEDPEALQRYEKVLPPSRVPNGVTATAGDDGCQCGTHPSPSRLPLSALLLLLSVMRERVLARKPKPLQSIMTRNS